MKRFHVHVVVDNLAANVEFYSKLFGGPPSKQRADYAKWMLDDPRVNFALSAKGHRSGVNHLGLQAETAEELAGLKLLAEDASGDAVLEQSDAACCYAKSEKHWTVDPQGVAWEHFLTTSDAPTFGAVAEQDGICCIPLRGAVGGKAIDEGCCLPNDTASQNTGCCL